MLDEFHERCLLNIAPEADKATYSRVKARLKNLMPSDKGNSYRVLQKLAEEVSYSELIVALAELAITDGRVRYGSAIIGCLDTLQSEERPQSPIN
jgi:hypothetical protein